MADEKKISITMTAPLGEKFIVEAKIPEDKASELAEALTALLEAPDDMPMIELMKLTGIDPKFDMMGFDFSGNDFTDAGDYFRAANMRSCNLRDTVWEGNIVFDYILLEGADLTGAKGLTEEKLSRAYINTLTILPEGIDRTKVNALHEALEWEKAPPMNYGTRRPVELEAQIHLKI